jgi:hypothetical protein
MSLYEIKLLARVVRNYQHWVTQNQLTKEEEPTRNRDAEKEGSPLNTKLPGVGLNHKYKSVVD